MFIPTRMPISGFYFYERMNNKHLKLFMTGNLIVICKTHPVRMRAVEFIRRIRSILFLSILRSRKTTPFSILRSIIYNTLQ